MNPTQETTETGKDPFHLSLSISTKTVKTKKEGEPLTEFFLKENIGALNGYIGKTTKTAVKDINDFLFMAGINYKLAIEHFGENQSQSALL